jgi:CoA:oxalate CoA-transferase
MLGVPELIDDERFETGPKRTRNHAVLEPVLNEAFRKRTTAEWYPDFLAAGIPCGPVNNVQQVVEDEHVRARGSIKDVTHEVAGTIPIVDTPVRMSRSETGIAGPPPSMGADTARVLEGWLGMSAEEVARLEGEGIVATSGGPDLGRIV